MSATPDAKAPVAKPRRSAPQVMTGRPTRPDAAPALSTRMVEQAMLGVSAETRTLMAAADAAVGKQFKEFLRSRGLAPVDQVEAKQRRQDALERDRQALAGRRALVEQGEVLDSRTICDLLDMTRQSLSRAVGAGRLFSLEVGPDVYYPRFFADPYISRRQLEKVCKALGDLSGWMKYNFFTQPRLSLSERTPLEELRRGNIDAVLEAASGMAEQ
jgi:hypothetical protein